MTADCVSKYLFIWFPLLISGAIITGGLIKLNQDANDDNDELERYTLATADVWRERLEGKIEATTGVARSMAGFAWGCATGIPPHTSPNVTLRQQECDEDRFHQYSADLFAANPGLFSLQLQPSAINTQNYPPGTGNVGRDLLNDPDRRQGVLDALHISGVVVVGPLILSQNGEVALIARYPVFLDEPRAFETWWGNVAVVIYVGEFMEATGIVEGLTELGMTFVLDYTRSGEVQPIISNTEDSVFKKDDSIHVPVELPNGFTWDLYVTPEGGLDSGVETKHVVGVVVGGICAFFVFAGILYALRPYYVVERRDNKNAVKYDDQPFCMMVTDIQASTALWANLPAEMPRLLDEHHEIIRHLIAKHKCYEVKTVGDRFMVVGKNPNAMLMLAVELQREFFQTEWDLADIDVAYRMKDGIDKGEGKHTLQEEQVRDDEYYSLWNGLRVRVGLHWGMGSIRYDEVTHSYDYNGDVVNVAALVQDVCHGGQIGCSGAFFEALEKGSMSKGAWTSLGDVQLHGLPTPTAMYQVLPSGLAARKFPPLRLNRSKAALPEEDFGQEETETSFHDGDSFTTSVSSSLSHHKMVREGLCSASELTQHFAACFTFLRSLLEVAEHDFADRILTHYIDRLKIPMLGSRHDPNRQAKVAHVVTRRLLPASYKSMKEYTSDSIEARDAGLSGIEPGSERDTSNR